MGSGRYGSSEPHATTAMEPAMRTINGIKKRIHLMDMMDLTRFGGHPKCGAVPRRGCLEGEARAAKKAFVHTGVQG